MKIERSFLTEEYVNKFCRPTEGKSACRYLTMTDGWNCEKGASLGHDLDERVGINNMNAQGDNCPGVIPRVIGLLCEGKPIDLNGKRVLHQESMPTYEVMGTVEGLFIDVISDGNKILCLEAKWDDGNSFLPCTSLEYISLYSRGDNIVISATFPGGNTWTFYTS